MKKAYFILILLFFRFTNIEAQITFEKTYNFWHNSSITGVYPQADGYILCGIYVSNKDVFAIDTIFTWPSSITSVIEVPNGDYKVSVNYSDGFGEHHVSQFLFTVDSIGKYLGKKRFSVQCPGH